MLSGMHKILFRKIYEAKNSKWILEKHIITPFVPFKGLVIQEPFRDSNGKMHYMPWTIGFHHEIQYCNIINDGYFLIEEIHRPGCYGISNEVETLINGDERKGWKLVSGTIKAEPVAKEVKSPEIPKEIVKSSKEAFVHE